MNNKQRPEGLRERILVAVAYDAAIGAARSDSATVPGRPLAGERVVRVLREAKPRWLIEA